MIKPVDNVIAKRLQPVGFLFAFSGEARWREEEKTVRKLSSWHLLEAPRVVSKHPIESKLSRLGPENVSTCEHGDR